MEGRAPSRPFGKGGHDGAWRSNWEHGHGLRIVYSYRNDSIGSRLAAFQRGISPENDADDRADHQAQ